MRRSERVEMKPYYYPGAGNNNTRAISLFPLCWGENKQRDRKESGWKKWMYTVDCDCDNDCGCSIGTTWARSAVCSIKVQHSHEAGTYMNTSHTADNCHIEQLMFAQYSVIVQLGVFNWASPLRPTPTSPQKVISFPDSTLA